MKTIELIEKLKNDSASAKKRFHGSGHNKKLFKNDREKPGDFKDKTFLFIRATEDDTGSRPLAPGTVFWNSPDIELYNLSGELIASNELIPNVSHTISVVVRNEGDMSCNSCNIELFICNPSIGFDMAHATPIGIQNHPLLGHGTVTSNFSFTPDATHIGHQCLFARAYSYVSADMPISANEFSTSTDRHIGQQNICILSEGSAFQFQIFTDQKFDREPLTLHIKQSKEGVNTIKIKGIKGLKPTTKDISVNRFECLTHIGPDAHKPIVNTPVPSFMKSYLFRLLKYILSLFFKLPINKMQYEKMAQKADGSWSNTYTKGLNKVTLNVPFMFLSRKEVAVFDVEMKNEKTGKVLGGITLVVKR